MRFYSNENFPLPVVEALRGYGHDVQTTAEAGNANQGIPDDEVLRYAAAEQRILLTLNRRDFISLHQRVPVHAGIVVCTFDADFSAQAERIDAMLRMVSSPDGQLLRVNRGA
jgi:predicted nuclease of predicted toxin-antitoxin system